MPRGLGGCRRSGRRRAENRRQRPVIDRVHKHSLVRHLWTKTADQILQSIATYRNRINESRH
jgi:hypothetical protein